LSEVSLKQEDETEWISIRSALLSSLVQLPTHENEANVGEDEPDSD